MENFYNVKEVAEILRCDKHQIYKYINNNQLKAVKISSLLIRKDWLEEFINKMMVTA